MNAAITVKPQLVIFTLRFLYGLYKRDITTYFAPFVILVFLNFDTLRLRKKWHHKHKTDYLSFSSDKLLTFTAKYITCHITNHHLLLFAMIQGYRHGYLVPKHWIVMISISLGPSEISFQCVLVCVYLYTACSESKGCAWVC